jgi:hypothetical protein
LEHTILKFIKVAGKLVQLDNGNSIKQRRNEMDVWFAFLVGLFIGGFLGMFIMAVLSMSKGE